MTRSVPAALEPDTDHLLGGTQHDGWNEPEADAKAVVRTSLQREVRDRGAGARPPEGHGACRLRKRHQKRVPGVWPWTPAARHSTSASRRDQHLRHIVQQFATLQDGMREPWGEAPTFARLAGGAVPGDLDMLPDLLSQAEAVIQALQDALAGTRLASTCPMARPCSCLRSWGSCARPCCAMMSQHYPKVG